MTDPEEKRGKAVCPVCGKEIDHLILIYEVVRKEAVVWTGNETEFETIDEVPVSPADEDWCCPVCSEVIANTLEEAEELMGVSH